MSEHVIKFDEMPCERELRKGDAVVLHGRYDQSRIVIPYDGIWRLEWPPVACSTPDREKDAK